MSGAIDPEPLPPSPLTRISTLIAVIEMSQSSWLVAGLVPGVERRPLKKLAVDEGSAVVASVPLAGRSGESGVPDRAHLRGL